MDEIKRTAKGRPLWAILELYHLRKREWKTLKTVCVVEGFTGSGKTTYLLNYFRGKNVFYFSFAGFEEKLAKRLFAERVAEKTGLVVTEWEDSFKAVSGKYRYILLDDLASLSSYKRFRKAFYDYMITNIYTRPFVALIRQPTEDLGGLADDYVVTGLDYFSLPEVMKLFPTLSKADTLGLCAMSGGIPKILHEYDGSSNFEDNLRRMLEPSSAFMRFMPELLMRYFRKPENYHHILCAIANGNHSVSGIGKYTGFAYNKCDNYLSGLISCGFVKTEKVLSKKGAEKTVYELTNSYFRLWHKYVYLNQTGIQLGNQKLVDGIIQKITDEEIHEFHLQKAFALANERIHWDLWDSFQISKNVPRAPETVSKGKFRYTFDAIARNGEKAVFIKVFADPLENCKEEALYKLRKAVMIANKYYDSHILIFSKRRFSDYAVAEAAKDETISLIEVDRLKY
ncbi:MAG: hypothetical protein FWD39_04980 [Clostridiales bacterium]|nr:hypothetical protein [Clostridiales bacterium]